MNTLQLEKSVNVPIHQNAPIQLELLKLHRPKPNPPPPPPPKRRKWRRLMEILKLFSVCGSMDLHRQIGPGMRPKSVERKEGPRRDF